ncbi:hypothetical protein HDU97_007630 [Phlyctochytrium planicorne]|nr:hypothetical protein HDU97_007630 [Phlyctochytrium planicorne]
MQLKTLFGCFLSLVAMQASAAPASIKPSDELATSIASIQKNIAIIKGSDLNGVDPKQILQTLAEVTQQVAVIADQTSILASAKEVITNSRIVKEIRGGLDKVEDVASRIGSKITKFIEFSTGSSSLMAREEDGEDVFFDGKEIVELDRRGGAKAPQTSASTSILTTTTTTTTSVAPISTQPPEESIGALKAISNKLKQTSNAISSAVKTVISSVTTPKARETAGTIAEISEEIATMSASLTTILGAAILIPAVNGVAAPAVAITAAITAIAKAVDQIATGISKSDADKIASGIKDGAAAGGVKPKN